MSKLAILLIGLTIGLITPLAVDYALFGTIEPCKTITKYEDGSSVQNCEVKN